MRCSICKQDKSGSCICGFCYDCLKENGHEGCKKIMQKRNIQQSLAIRGVRYEFKTNNNKRMGNAKFKNLSY